MQAHTPRFPRCAARCSWAPPSPSLLCSLELPHTAGGQVRDDQHGQMPGGEESTAISTHAGRLQLPQEGQRRVVKEVQATRTKGAGGAHGVEHAAAAATARELKVNLQGQCGEQGGSYAMHGIGESGTPRLLGTAVQCRTAGVQQAAALQCSCRGNLVMVEGGDCCTCLPCASWHVGQTEPPTLALVPLPQMREVWKAMR